MTPTHSITILDADGVWRHPHEDAPTSRADAEQQITEWFANDAGGVVASLKTVSVWLHSDAGWRDVTEDTLDRIGVALSAAWEQGDTFPAAWLQWADDEIQAEHAYRAEVAMAADARRYDGEAA